MSNTTSKRAKHLTSKWNKKLQHFFQMRELKRKLAYCLMGWEIRYIPTCIITNCLAATNFTSNLFVLNKEF